MNRFARIISLVGAIVIVVLLIAVFFGSRKIAQEIETRINEGLKNAKAQLQQSEHTIYGIHNFDYEPFSCSGFMDYTCKSNSISLYTNDPTTRDNKLYESIRLKNIAFHINDVRSKNHLAIEVETDLQYPNINSFFGDSKTNLYVNFFNQIANALLPNKLQCKQDYNYMESSELEKNMIESIASCNFQSEIMSALLQSQNIFAPNIDKSHILGVLYEIAMATNGNSDMQDLQLQNIPHILKSLKISLQSKSDFKTFLNNNDKLSKQDKATLQIQFDANMSLLQQPINFRFIRSLIGKSGVDITQGLINLGTGKTKTLDINFEAKDTKNFQPLRTFEDKNLTEWFEFFNKNYNATITLDKLTQSNKQDSQDTIIETDEKYNIQTTKEQGDDTQAIPQDSKNTKSKTNHNKTNELLNPPSLLES